MSFVIYSLAMNPDIQTQCQTEVDLQLETEAVRTAPLQDTAKTVTHLPVFVEAVLKESMRKYPALNRGSLRLVKDKEGTCGVILYL